MAFFFLLFSLVKPRGISRSALRHGASASFNRNLFPLQVWGLRNWLIRKCPVLNTPVGAGFFLNNFSTSRDNNLQKALAEGLRFPLLFPHYSHPSHLPSSDTGLLPQAHPIHQPSSGTFPSSFFGLPCGISRFISSVMVCRKGCESVLWGRIVWGQKEAVENYSPEECILLPLVTHPFGLSSGKGGERCSQRLEVPCVGHYDRTSKYKGENKWKT